MSATLVTRVFFHIVIVGSILSSSLLTYPAHAQPGLPDYIALDAQRALNGFLADVVSQRETPEGVVGTLSLRNPFNSLYLCYSIQTSGAGLALRPASPIDELWHGSHVLPPTLEARYEVMFNDTNAYAIIESDPLDLCSIRATLLFVVLDFIPGLSSLSRSQVMQAIGDFAKAVQLLEAFVNVSEIRDVLRNPTDLAGNAGRLTRIASGLMEFADSQQGKQFLLGVLQRSQVAGGEDLLKRAFDVFEILGKLQILVDIAVGVGALGIWPDRSVHRYHLYAMNTDSRD